MHSTSVAHTATQPAPRSPSPTIEAIHQPSTTRTVTPTIHLPSVTLIGDSIMQGAAPMIEDVLGEDIHIDAARKRKMEDVPALAKTLSRAGHLSRVVVIHLGSNRPFEDPVFDAVMVYQRPDPPKLVLGAKDTKSALRRFPERTKALLR